MGQRRRSVGSTAQVSEANGAGQFLRWGPAPLKRLGWRFLAPVSRAKSDLRHPCYRPAPLGLPTCTTDFPYRSQTPQGEGWHLRSSVGNRTCTTDFPYRSQTPQGEGWHLRSSVGNRTCTTDFPYRSQTPQGEGWHLRSAVGNRTCTIHPTDLRHSFVIPYSTMPPPESGKVFCSMV